MKKKSMFIPLTKIDEEQRLVYGVATAEKSDRAGETMHYDSSKPFYEKWSEEVKKASGGKSLGNVRAMHGKVAAGKLQEIVFNDEDKQIEVCAKVVDDNEWKKVQEGLYTGFSHGGSYVKVWKEGEKTYYTADPVELSLVDIPCLKEAAFSVIKSDGATELRKFAIVVEEPSLSEIGKHAETLAKDVSDGNWRDFMSKAADDLMQKSIEAAFEKALAEGEEESTDDKEEDEEKKDKKKAKKTVEPQQVWKCNHPDHSHLHKSQAVKCMKADEVRGEMEKVAAPVTDALGKLEAALGKNVTQPPATTTETPADPPAKETISKDRLVKGLHTVSRLACLIDELVWLQNDVKWEAEHEGDKSPLPDAIKQSIASLCNDLKAMVIEETSELFGEEDAIATMILEAGAGLDDGQAQSLRKVFGENHKFEKTLTKITSALPDFGGIAKDLETVRDSVPETAEKAREYLTKYISLAQDMSKAGARHSKQDVVMIQQMHGLACALGALCDSESEAAKGVGLDKSVENEELRKVIDSLTPRIEALAKQVEDLRSQPAPAKAVITPVNKGTQIGSSDAAAEFAKKLEEMSPEERSRELMKLALSKGNEGHPSHYSAQ